MKVAVLLLANNILKSTNCPEPIVANEASSPMLAITREMFLRVSVENADLSLGDSDLGLYK